MREGAAGLYRRLPLIVSALGIAVLATKPVTMSGQSVPDCAVTTPQAPPFVPPFPYPTAAPRGWFWYGSDALWTWLPVSGKAIQRDKSFWWHPGFYPRIEPDPAFRIEAIHLQTNARIVARRAMNAFAEDLGGWTMLTSLELPLAGCWDVTATYQGARVEYVVAVD